VIALNLPWDSQPQDAVEVDWGNPLARGLTALLVPTVSGQQLYNVVHGGQISATGTITRVVGPSGLGQRYGDASGTAYQTYTFPAGYVETVGSVFWKGQRNAAGPAIFRDNQSATANTLVWENGAGAWNARVDGNNIASSEGSFPIDTDIDFLLTGDTAGSNFFVKGVRLDTLDTVPWNWRGSSLINWHQNTNNGNGVLATDYLIALYNRRLSAQEARELSANPWQLFAPRQIWIPATAAASFNPTLSLPTYVPGSLTSSAFRPRVTATWS
jgi:hypothetical protein